MDTPEEGILRKGDVGEQEAALRWRPRLPPRDSEKKVVETTARESVDECGLQLEVVDDKAGTAAEQQSLGQEELGEMGAGSSVRQRGRLHFA